MPDTKHDRRVPGDVSGPNPRGFAPLPQDERPPAWQQFDALSRRAEPVREPAEHFRALARATLRARKMRSRHLPGSMFGEPAWDMLLCLYVMDKHGARQTVTSLTCASGAPATTALRWVDYLEKQKYLTRRDSSTDRRVVFLDLTDTGRQTIERYLADVHASGIVAIP